MLEVLKRLFREMSHDNVTGLAASCAYSAVFSIFPALIVLVAIAGLLHAHGVELPPEVADVLPASVRDLVEGRLSELASTPHTGAITIGILGSVWSAFSGVTTLITAVNRARDIQQKRPLWKQYGLALLLTLAGLVLLLAPILLGALGGIGESVLQRFGLAAAASWLALLRWPIMLAGMLAWLLLLFRFAPEKRPERVFSAGLLLAAIGMLVLNRLFGLYLELSGGLTVTYGALGGFMAMLLWLYLSALILLVGVELDAVLEAMRRERPLPPKGLPALRRRTA